MISAVVETNSMAFPANYDLARMPASLPERNQERFFSRYDFTSIFYDIFEDDGRLMCVGPPMMNLSTKLGAASIKLDGRLPVERLALRWDEMDRVTRSVVPIPVGGAAGWCPTSVSLDWDDLELTASVGRNYSELFRGKHVLCTQNRNNPLTNISDWVKMNVHANEIDAVLVFDNRSDQYSAAELVATLEQCPGIDVAVVVNWPHPFGVLTRNWDADFGQYCAWEVARWRFAKYASSLLLCDVDELLLSEDGKPVHVHATQSANGVCYFPTRNIEPVQLVDQPEPELRRHADYAYYRDRRWSEPKYAAIPSRLSERQQLKVHAVTYAPSDGSRPGYVRHFRALHIGWREGKLGYSHRLRSATEELEMDTTLLRVFESL